MKSITDSFKHIGLPLKQHRKSWGASNDKVVVLRPWTDKTGKADDGVLCSEVWHPRWKKSYGETERLKHITEIKAGKAAYVILVNDANLGKDTDERKIAPSKARRIFRCGELREDGENVQIELISNVNNLNELRDEIAMLSSGVTK